MKRWGIFLAAGIILSAVLAYFLHGWINDKVIVPLAYLWWRIGIYYHSVSEDIWWGLVIVMICLMAFASTRPDEWPFHYYQDLDTQPMQGPVEELMRWMIKLRRNKYYKWLIANRLGKLARSFLVQREGGNVHHWDGSLNSPVWELPKAVAAYLKSGLKRPTLQNSSPLNLDPQQAVEYLESQMEDRSNGN
jgi:MFS family permease